mmetsp:Transcript_30855/g.49644  ORF Transcript_30855/g.49644 Transcript_30855/m.49644 type:complete len:686 (+) Transcript_30855:819-2876(+)
MLMTERETTARRINFPVKAATIVFVISTVAVSAAFLYYADGGDQRILASPRTTIAAASPPAQSSSSSSSRRRSGTPQRRRYLMKVGRKGHHYQEESSAFSVSLNHLKQQQRNGKISEVLRANVEVPSSDIIEAVSSSALHLKDFHDSLLSSTGEGVVVHHQLHDEATTTTTAAAAAAQQMFDLASEPVVLPCHRMRCTTAQPATPGLKKAGVALLSALFLYLTSTPGVLAGVLDMYLIAPIQRLIEPNFKYNLDDLAIGKMIAEGGFGEVYRATLIGKKQTRDVIVKRAKEFGRPEVWMNERMQRSAPGVIAEYITAFNEDTEDSISSPILLVWNNEGEYTLSSLMTKQDFPFNVAPLLFDESQLPMDKTKENKIKIIQRIMEQILSGLKACHSTGIVHRDIKPQNFIVSQRDKRVKLIDLGAAADLRIGINYVPNEFLLDPRYAPPQQYIMSTRTPKAPPAPIAVFLSPVLWQMNYPDRFDIYSAGMSMLQMVFAPLRSDNALIVFNRRMRKEFKYDLQKWRKAERSKLYQEGFEILDANGGAGWDLLRNLLSFEPKERPSAAEALGHPFFEANLSPMGLMNSAWAYSGKALDKIINSDILLDYVGGKARGLDKIFTEVELKEQFADEFRSNEASPSDLDSVSNTIRWWDGRNKALERNKMDATETQLMYDDDAMRPRLLYCQT